MKFKPGQSGNPKGKAKGTRNRATMAAKAILEGEAEALTRKAVQMAMSGDPVALRLCLERIYPKPKEGAIKAKLPRIDKAENIPKAMATIFAMVGTGSLTPDQAQTLSGIITNQGKALELAELERRIQILEEAK